MSKLQGINRKDGSVNYFVYLPKGELEQAGFSRGDDLYIRTVKKGVILLSSSQDAVAPVSTHKSDVAEITVPAELFTESNLITVESQLSQPLLVQRQLAAKLKVYLDNQIQADISLRGGLTDNTRRWTTLYASLLDSIHKNTFGEKSVNLNVSGRITHAQIACMMRQAAKYEVVDSNV